MAAATTAILTTSVAVSFGRWLVSECKFRNEKLVREDAMIEEIKDIWFMANRLDEKEPLLDFLISRAGSVEQLLENVRNKYDFETTIMRGSESDDIEWIVPVGRSANVGVV